MRERDFGRGGQYLKDDDDAVLDQGEQPDTVQRRCTDCPCCLVFLAALLALGYVVLYAVANGDPERFLGLPNTQGQFCGVSEGVHERPFLYFCNGTHFPDEAICVAVCPDPLEGASLHSGCPGIAPDYHTRPLGGILCLPREPREAMQLAKAIEQPTVHWILEIGEVFRTWELVLISALAAVVLGFLYLFFLEKCAACVVWLGLVTVVGVLAALGGYLVYVSQEGNVEGLEVLQGFQGTGNPQGDLLVGVCACVLSVLLTCCACSQAEKAGTALTCIQEASDCIGDMRSLLFQPLLELVGKCLLFSLLATGFLHLASCVRLVHHELLGHSFDVEYTREEYLYLAYYGFMTLWLMEIFSALSQFVISYTTQLWYFATRVRHKDASQLPRFPTCQAVGVGCCYHLGTFAYGSFIIALTRGLRDIMILVTKEAGEEGNSVMACCGCCCSCLLECFNRFLKFMTKTAYMDTAINSNDFCKAAYHSAMILTHFSSEVVTLNAATLIFQVAGIGGIAGAGGLLTHILCTHLPRYSEEESVRFVENPLALDAVSAVVCAIVAWPFMLLLDHVSDTLLFCAAVERMRTPPPAPPTYDETDEEQEACCSCFKSSPPSRASERGSPMDPETQALLRR